MEEKKKKLENNVGKRSSSSWVAGRSREVGLHPPGAPSEAGQTLQRCPEMKTKAAFAVTERRGIREMYNVPLCAISFLSFLS